MRRDALIVILVLAATSAGCADDAAEGDASTPTPSSGAPTPTPGATPTGPGGAAAFTPVDIAHDFTEAPATSTFDVPPNAGLLRLRVWIAADANGVCAIHDAAVVLRAPDGSEVARVGSGATSVSAANPICAQGIDRTSEMAAGAWTVEFVGQGVGTGRVTVER